MLLKGSFSVKGKNFLFWWGFRLLVCLLTQNWSPLMTLTRDILKLSVITCDFSSTCLSSLFLCIFSFWLSYLEHSYTKNVCWIDLKFTLATVLYLKKLKNKRVFFFFKLLYMQSDFNPSISLWLMKLCRLSCLKHSRTLWLDWESISSLQTQKLHLLGAYIFLIS